MKASRWILLAVLVVAIVLRFYKLGSWPLEQDELYTLHDAEIFGERVNYLRPFYYFLQHSLLQVLPSTPFFLRLPPFAFGVLGVWLTWLLGRKTFGTTAGLVSASIVALSPWHLYASQFARYWTLVYALAAVVYLTLQWAVKTDRKLAYWLTCLTILVGTLTHPSFVFSLIGVAVAVYVVSEDGSFGWNWPTKRAWLSLWGPLGTVAIAGFVFLLLEGSFARMAATRGLPATLRLILAIVEWTNPAVVVSALLGFAYLLIRGDGQDRRWGAMAGLGCVSGVGLLVAASVYRSAYADYAMALLPLIYVTVGGLVQRVSEILPAGRRAFAVGATAILLTAVFPSLASHLSDGTRFDYRVVYGFLRQSAGDNLVLAWPEVIQRYYAPDLKAQRLGGDPAYLDRTLKDEGGFWLVGSYRRRGMLLDTGETMHWVDSHCRRVMTAQRPRFDYRSYRVELHWCGPDPVPAANELPNDLNK